MWGWNLNLQSYATAAGYDEAFAIASVLIRAVEPTAAVKDCLILPYYKTEGQYGIRLTLSAPSLEEAYRTLLGLAPSWSMSETGDEASAIWDGRVDGPNRIVELTWMHLNLLQLSDD